MSRRTCIALPVLCLLAGSGWLLDEWLTPPAGGLAGAALRLCVPAGFFLLWAGRARHAGAALPRARLMRVGVCGAILFGVPQIVAVAAGGDLSRFAQVLISTLVPVMVVVAVTQQRAVFGASASPLRLLAPALTGLAGATLLLPFHPPRTGIGWMWLMAAVLSSCASALVIARLHLLLQGVPTARAGALMCLFAAALEASFAWVHQSPVSSWSGLDPVAETARLSLEVPATILTVWLLRELSPVEYSSRFLLVPLVTLLEGSLLLRPAPTWTLTAGLALLGGGGLWLLQADQEETQAALGGGRPGR